MALKGYVRTQSGVNYVHTLFVNVVSQDPIANTTRVYYRYAVHSNRSLANGAWTTLNNTEFTAYVNGVAHSASPNFDFRTRKDYDMVTGYQTITNDSDGSLTLALRVVGEAVPGSLYFGAVDSGTVNAFDAPTVPRSSTVTLTPNPVVSGGTVQIDIVRAVGTFVHDITWESGVDSGTIGTGVATSATFTPDSGLLGGSPRVPITITVITKTAGGTVIGTQTYDLMMIAAPEYPEVGVGTPYDIRFRRVELEGGELVPKEIIPFLQATQTDTLSASGSLEIIISKLLYDTDLDEAVVVGDVYDGANWIGENKLYVLTRVETDKTEEAQTAQYSGMSYVDYLLSKNVVAADYDWPVANPGNIIHQYITLAQARDWGPFVRRSFTQTTTTLGTPYQNTTDINATKGTPVSQLLDGFVSDVLCEYATHFDVDEGMAYLDIYNPGYGADWTVTGANPVVNLATAALWKVADKAPVRKDYADKLTRVLVEGDEASVTRERASAVNPLLGHLEGTVNASGVKTTSKLNQMGDASLNAYQTATVERTFSYDLSSTQTPHQLYPYRTFRVGDWIFVPSDSGPERVRVSQIAISRDEDSTTATITVGDMIPSGVAALARKQTQSGGGAIAGGTMRSPLPLSAAIPAAPEVLDAVPTAYWDVSGLPQAGVYVTWTPVSASLNDTDIVVDQYELWSRVEVGQPWKLELLSDTTDGTIAPTLINSTLDVRVRARSEDGIYGPYGDEYSVVTSEPATDLAGPDLADLYTDGVGNIFAVWGGTIDSDPAPAKLGYVVAEISDDEGATYVTAGTPIVAAGPIIINKTGAWGLYSVRLRGYDRLGNPGDASASQDITITDPHIDPAIPEAPTSLTVTAGADWDASGYFPEAWFDLEWVAPTLDVDGDPVTIVGYDIWGFPGGAIDPEFLTSVTSTTARIKVVNGEVWSFQVRASSNYGGVSAFTEPVSETADATIDAPAAPTAPTLSQYAGILRIQWSGGGMVPQVKKVYATLSTDPGGPFTRVGMPLLGAGDVVVTNLAAGSTYYAKIVLEDEMGQTATSAASDGLVLLPITGVTIQTSEVADTGIKMNTGSLTAYDDSGNPTFILDATTGEVWIAPYDAVFEFGAAGTAAETGTPTTGLAISSEDVSFNTFFHAGGVQIRNDQTPLSWWEADADDASLVNFVSPRARVEQRLRIGDYELLKETKTTGSRLVMRYMGA